MLSNLAWANSVVVNSVNDRETDGYTAVDYVRYDRLVPWGRLIAHRTCSTIAQTLNDGHHVKSYGGLSKADTRYPISAFVTHLVYLRGTAVEVDVPKITVCL